MSKKSSVSLVYNSPSKNSYTSRVDDFQARIPFEERFPRPISHLNGQSRNAIVETPKKPSVPRKSRTACLGFPTGTASSYRYGNYTGYGGTQGYPISELNVYDSVSHSRGYFGGQFSSGAQCEKKPSTSMKNRKTTNSDVQSYSYSSELDRRYKVYDPKGKQKRSRNQQPATDTMETSEKVLSNEMTSTLARQIDEAWNRYMQKVELYAPPQCTTTQISLDDFSDDDADQYLFDQDDDVQVQIREIGHFDYHPQAPAEYQPDGHYDFEITGPKTYQPHHFPDINKGVQRLKKTQDKNVNQSKIDYGLIESLNTAANSTQEQQQDKQISGLDVSKPQQTPKQAEAEEIKQRQDARQKYRTQLEKKRHPKEVVDAFTTWVRSDNYNSIFNQ